MQKTKGKTFPPNKGMKDVEFALTEEMKKANEKDRAGFILDLTKNKALMEGETASAFSFASARALAKLGAAMANKGSFEGT